MRGDSGMCLVWGLVACPEPGASGGRNRGSLWSGLRWKMLSNTAGCGGKRLRYRQDYGHGGGNKAGTYDGGSLRITRPRLGLSDLSFKMAKEPALLADGAIWGGPACLRISQAGIRQRLRPTRARWHVSGGHRHASHADSGAGFPWWGDSGQAAAKRCELPRKPPRNHWATSKQPHLPPQPTFV